MPYNDGNPTLGEQIDEDARIRFYTDDLVKEGLELGRENDRLRAALKEIESLEARPFDGFPEDWSKQIDQCSECQRYKGHPIQQGICDEHRKPLWAREKHDRDELMANGYRMKLIARNVLEKSGLADG